MGQRNGVLLKGVAELQRCMSFNRGFTVHPVCTGQYIGIHTVYTHAPIHVNIL